MKRGLSGLAVAAIVLVALTAVRAYAQGTTTSAISGVVVDSNGGIVPGATVVVKNNGTGTAITLVSNGTGSFSAPSLDAGTYTVTITLQGFKTYVAKDVKLVAATPANLGTVVLQVGDVSQTVEVKAGTELVQTQASAVASTLNIKQITSLPVVTQNGSAFIANLPGVDTAAGNHSIRSSTINGLPQGAINISLDGINDQDNSNKSTDGFWAMVHPKLDQVEEVTVTGAVPGADSSGQGAVTVKWVTRSGSNQYDGSAYEFFRSPGLNTNNYFNTLNGLGKNQIKLHQYGVREGGPIKQNKFFFFANDEEFHRPGSTTYTRNTLTSTAQSGLFQYTVNGQVQTVNLLAVAAGAGNPLIASTMDPTVAGLLQRIAAATGTQGTVKPTADPNRNQYVYQGIAGRNEHNPTVRFDYNLTNSERITATYNWQEAFQHPDGLNDNGPVFPGFPNYLDQTSYRNLGSYTLRSTLSSNLVNEAVGGFLWSPIDFSGPLGPAQFEDQGGFSLNFPSLNGTTLTSGTVSTAISQRNASHWDLNDTLTWVKGRHNMSFGGTFSQINYWMDSQTAVPQISFGVDSSNDPASALFTAANFPGASNANLNDARALYSLLVGDVTAINGNIRLDANSGQYAYMGKGRQAGGMKEWGLFTQDAWRATPTLTFNLGVRYEVQMPFVPHNSTFSTTDLAGFCGVSGVSGGDKCNLFKPGTLGGTATTYTQYQAGNAGYHTDWNNVAPSLGVAWRPNVKSGWLHSLLGDPEQATITAGWAIAYNRDSMGTFSGVFASNPGLTITENRNATTGLLVPAGSGQVWPVLLRQTDRLGAPPFCGGSIASLCMPLSPAYPMSASLSNSVNIFDPDFQVAHSTSTTIGLQRSLSKDMAVSIRYVGTRNHDGITNQNLNELVVVENGFAHEFQLAQANLQANLAAGKGATFAYTGAPGTFPLPIYLANLVGSTAAGDPSAYTGTNWTSSTMVNQLGLIQGGTPISSAASTLQSSATFRANMLKAGLPTNFWVMNPDVSAANMEQGINFTKYDSLQVEVRRRLARGLTATGNYTYALRYTSVNDTLRLPQRLILDTSGVKHAFKTNWTWEIPVGHGRRFGANMNKVLDDVAGGWEFSGVGRVQSGNLLDFGNVQLVGMTLDDLRNAYHIQFRNNPTTGLPTVYMLPQDIIDNTILAFSTSATSPTGYSGAAPTGRYIAPANSAGCLQIVRGDCAPRDVFVTGPVFARFDITARKTVPLGGRKNFQFEVDIFNVFNAIGFNAVAQASSSATIDQVTSAYSDVSNTFDPGGRLGQLVFRFNW